MSPETKNMVLTVINTLNTIEVKGRTNLDHLLGAIMMLEQLVQMPDPNSDDIKIEEIPDEQN